MKIIYCTKSFKKILDSLLLVAMILCFAIMFFACDSIDDTQKNQGFCVSGQITNDKGLLANVEILKNNQDFFPSVSTNSNGVFLATGLAAGDILTFKRYGYTFSPSKYEVMSDFFDLRISALNSNTTDDESSENEDSSNDTGESENANPTDTKCKLTIISNRISLVNDKSGDYENGTKINLSAKEEDGWQFCGWFVSNTLLENGNSLNYNYTLINSSTIEARFQQIPLSPVLNWNETGNTLSWDDCENSDSYNIYADDILVKSTSLTLLNLENFVYAGPTTISVEAVGNIVYNFKNSHKSTQEITIKKQLSTAKNIGFMQNDTEKFLIFSVLSKEYTKEIIADGFSLSIEKDNIVWTANTKLDSLLNKTVQHIKFTPQISKETLITDEQNLSEQATQNIDCYSFYLEAEAFKQYINDKQYTTIKIKFSNLFNDISAIIAQFNQNLIENPNFSELLSLDCLCEVGNYAFSIKATSTNQFSFASESKTINYFHTNYLKMPTNLYFIDNILTFYDRNCIANDENTTIIDITNLKFILVLNDIKIATILYTDCLLPTNQQTSTATNAIDISPFISNNIDNINSISLIAAAENYINTPSETLIL